VCVCVCVYGEGDDSTGSVYCSTEMLEAYIRSYESFFTNRLWTLHPSATFKDLNWVLMLQ
jgi:hypothetical protein